MTERPFTLLPDPDFLFWSPAHKRAYSVLEYGLMTRAPLTVVTGEVGAGKTTLIQALLASKPENTVIGLISNAHGDRGDLLRWVLNALDAPHDPASDYVALHQCLLDFVIALYSDGRHVVLVIDEAQNLSVEALEELRLLTNINSNKDELLQLVLVGQPELGDMIQRPELRQFAQRIGATYHIKALDFDNTVAYVTYRLKHAGASGNEFSAAALRRIYFETCGVPRMINKLCDMCLVYAAGGDKEQVDNDIIEELIEDGIFVNPLKDPPLVLKTEQKLPGAAAE